MHRFRTVRKAEIPVIPLRDSVLFPHATLPFVVARESSGRLLEALGDEKNVVLATQRDPRVDEPGVDDLYPVGTLTHLVRVVHMPQNRGTHLVVAEGLQRVRLLGEKQRAPFLTARCELLVDLVPAQPDDEYLALAEALKTSFAEIIELSPVLSNDLLPVVATTDDASLLTDFVATALQNLPTCVRQELLETLDVHDRMKRLEEELLREREKLALQQKIRAEIQEKLAGAQRELFLREQIKAIQHELGEKDEQAEVLDGLRRRVEEAGMPEEAKAEADRELARLAQIPPAAAEYTVSRTYLDWLTTLPWKEPSGAPIDVVRAEQILDEDHHDLERVKERIVEYLAVVQLKRDLKGPILCFVGPPGVGKTSLGKSIARALGRRFVRISLGGMHDEAEIRGHRRTYVGALPGQILQGIRRAGSRDPIFMLDEVDKLGRDFRGDPASALLEVLDPEQNFSFRDHYLDVPFDLSKVLFITTANVLEPVPPALLDRMEVLELPGYTDEEKLHIAQRFLVPRAIQEHGMREGDHLRFEDDGLVEIIRSYTHEAGVRNLGREIGAICRKQARRIAKGEWGLLTVGSAVVREHLGAPRFEVETELEERTRTPGVAVALAWTPAGGDILFVEAALMERDKGEFTVTGQIGDVMQESTKAALSWLRANGSRYAIEPARFKGSDLHIHVPAGSVPKDGPSAGVVMAAALASLFTGRRVRPRVALTGEITLSGQVLPVGGIKEKVLAARRCGVREIILPAKNEPNVTGDLPEHLRVGIAFHYVKRIDEALDLALEPPPT
ncbi:MAG: endopeptidase La [Deltaproteobacteria bacterium]|nr:endopeptidase La [Deltaproteobacteria bacterium]